MAIISISGKIGSGKDTVACIIQELSKDKKWEIKKWAYKLKEVASLLTGIPVHKFEDQEFKKTDLSHEWDKPNYINNEYVGTVPMKVREFLQILGTESIRDVLHTNTWVNALLSDYKTCSTVFTTQNDVDVEDYWIITDTRFPNELAAAKAKGAITLNVIRSSDNEVGTSHSSETALDDYIDWDDVIYNDSTLDDLTAKVREVLCKHHISVN